MKELYLAGAKNLLQELFVQIKGVESVETGRATSVEGLSLIHI